CATCRQLFHFKCIESLTKPLLFGDTFYNFQCSVCRQGPEIYERLTMSWLSIVHLTLYNLLKLNRNRKYFQWKDEICRFIEEHWEYLNPRKSKYSTWNNTVASVLSIHPEFLSGASDIHKTGWWTLRENSPPEKNLTKYKTNLKKHDSSLISTPSKRKPTITKDDAKCPLIGNSTKRVKSVPSNLDISSNRIESILPPIHSISPEAIKRTFEMCLETPIISQSFEDTFHPEVMFPQPWKARIKKQIFRKEKGDEETQDHNGKDLINSQDNSLSNTNNLPICISSHDSKAESKLPIQTFSSSGSSNNKPKADLKSENDKNKIPRIRLIIKATNKHTTDSLKMSQISSKKASLPKELPDMPSTKKNKLSFNNRQNLKLVLMDEQQEWNLLQDLENTNVSLSPKAARLKRKLHLRRIKRDLGLKIFDLDSVVTEQLKSSCELEPMVTKGDVDWLESPIKVNAQTKPDSSGVDEKSNNDISKYH
ncbi:hypothetical protein G9A89_007731, partial [Geosiphon pyriformis]